MADETRAEVYRLQVWIGRISPMIWRRLLELHSTRPSFTKVWRNDEALSHAAPAANCPHD